jgi:hypothetical protein
MRVRSIAVSVAGCVAVTLSAGACTGADQAVYRTTTDKGLGQLLPLAVDVAVAKGYRVTREDFNSGELLIVRPDESRAMLVRISSDAGRQGSLSCFGIARCATWFMVTPVSHEAASPSPPNAVMDEARALAAAIGEHAQ